MPRATGQAAVLRVEGFTLALGKIFEVAQDVDQNAFKSCWSDSRDKRLSGFRSAVLG